MCKNLPNLNKPCDECYFELGPNADMFGMKEGDCAFDIPKDKRAMLYRLKI